MDNEVKEKFELIEQHLNKSIENINSRLDLIKWYVGGIVGMVAVVYAAASVIFSINYNTDRNTFNTHIQTGLDELKRFQDNIKEQIKLTIGTPEDSRIELYTIDALPLMDQKIVLTPLVDNGTVVLRIGFIIKNMGNAQSGPLYFKVYFQDPFDTGSKSADEPKFKFEYHINPEDIRPNIIPGGYTSTFHLSVDVPANVLGIELKAAAYPAMIKVYYGKGKVTSASVSLVINKDIQLSDAPSSSPNVPPAQSTR